jgi:hypothetical protein
MFACFVLFEIVERQIKLRLLFANQQKQQEKIEKKEELLLQNFYFL